MVVRVLTITALLVLLVGALLLVSTTGTAQTEGPTEGGGCNAETGEPGSGEGAFERQEDGTLECIVQPGEPVPPFVPPAVETSETPTSGEAPTPIKTPTRIDTGGGYCALSGGCG